MSLHELIFERMSEIFDFKSWVGKANDWQPKAMITLHAVAVNTNLQDNEGKLSSLFNIRNYMSS